LEIALKISFALLAHGNPHLVERLIRLLATQGHTVAVHYDLKSPLASYEHLVRSFKGNDSVRFAHRVRVGWGEWSVCQGTLNCLDQIKEAEWDPEYVYLLSGLDYPIRPCAQLEAFLSGNKGQEFIEGVPSDTVQWVKTGPQKERYLYRWHFNWRDQVRRTELSFKLQKMLRLKRKFVRGLIPFLGSQWWVLTWTTLQKIMECVREPDIVNFFKTTLIPDELFFQTLVNNLVPRGRVVNCSLTLYQFSDYGYPVVYHADHLDYLHRQPFFMARKLSAHSNPLRDALDQYWTGAKSIPPFDYEHVGIVNSEYEDWRLAYRNGAPGIPVVGRSAGRWYDDQKRLTIPYFVLIGTSTAELRLAHKALSWHSDLLCHGQLFHPALIEFAGNLPTFAGYGINDVALRQVSAPNFVADIVRAEKRRMSGFLLRWGQGWHIPELMVDRPNVRVAILRGEPLISFIENIQGGEPLLDQPFDIAALRAIPPNVMANRFRRFLNDYEQHTVYLDKQTNKAGDVKPRGWVARPDLTVNGHDWLELLESWLDVSLSGAPQGAGKDDLASELGSLAERRELVIELLIRGGINRVVFDMLRREPNNPAAALSLI
jgi:hypothetical protein